MQKFMRTACPDFLTSKWEEWGSEYRNKREQKLSYSFNWPTLEGKRLNAHLLPLLKSLTRNHCSYCDGAPLMKSDDTIDHFRPKSNPLFYNEVCKWENLYVACNRCQCSKKEKYDDKLLRPDEEAYSFFDFFTYDYHTHGIEVNPAASAENQARAKITIGIFDFNEVNLLKSRKIAFERFNFEMSKESTEYTFDDFNFRFMLKIF